MPRTRTKWQFYEKGWVDFDPEASAELEAKFALKQPVFTLSSGFAAAHPGMYRIDLHRSSQTNTRSQYERSIRRLGNHPPRFTPGLLVSDELPSAAPQYYRAWQYGGPDDWHDLDAPACALLDAMQLGLHAEEDDGVVTSEGLDGPHEADLTLSTYTLTSTVTGAVLELRSGNVVAPHSELDVAADFLATLKTLRVAVQPVTMGDPLSSTNCVICTCELLDDESSGCVCAFL